MPRKRATKSTGLSEKEITIIVLVIASIIIFALINQFIVENPWARIIVFVVFAVILFLSGQKLISDIKSNSLDKNTLWALGGGVISIIIIAVQIKFLISLF